MGYVSRRLLRDGSDDVAHPSDGDASPATLARVPPVRRFDNVPNAPYSGSGAMFLEVACGCTLTLCSRSPDRASAASFAPSFIADLVASATGTEPLSHGTIDFAFVFATRMATLRRECDKLEKRLAPDGMVWVAWPKKSSGVSTDLSFESAQRAGLDVRLVDTKICAIDETWSGLKFVRRLADRETTTKKATR